MQDPRSFETICNDRMWCEPSLFPSYDECRRFEALHEVLKRMPEASYMKIRAHEFHWFIPHKDQYAEVQRFLETHPEEDQGGDVSLGACRETDRQV